MNEHAPNLGEDHKSRFNKFKEFAGLVINIVASNHPLYYDAQPNTPDSQTTTDIPTE